MKVWIIYDSKSVQCKKLAEALEDLLEGYCAVSVGIVKKISPADVAAELPDAVIVGGPLHFGKPSQDIVSWVKQLYQITRKSTLPIKKAFAFYTWSRTPTGEPAWRQMFQKYSFATNIFPQVLAMKVEPKGVTLSFEKNSHFYDIIERLRQFLLHED